MNTKPEKEIQALKAQIDTLQAQLWEMQTLAALEGHDQQEIEKRLHEDQAFLKEAQDYQQSFNAIASTFFGYPGNLTEDSPLVSRLRHLEAQMVYINNAGDPYEQGDSTLDGKLYERKVLDLFYQKFGMDPKASWGYVTSGGSESNTWAIRNGFRKFPNGRMYFSEAAHYSVLKAVTNGDQDLFPYTIIPQTDLLDERLDVSALMDAIQKNWKHTQTPAILLMTWGTTKTGACDPIQAITTKLTELQIPFYVHVDAAYFGGIPNNQIDAPICPSLNTLGADSISVSFHKYFGVPDINSIVLSKDKADGQFIDYLGHRDTTVSGSRTFSIFSAYWRIKEVLERSPKEDYRRNIVYFENALIQHKISYYRAPLSSIFVFPLPSKAIISKYNLASFKGASGQITLAHAIINPFHPLSDLDALIADLAQDQLNSPSVLDR